MYNFYSKAGDCPHSAHLEATLQHHHHHDAGDATTSAHLEASLQHHHHEAGDGPVILVDNHEKYLKIIDDLKNDLERMSCEVVQVQQECCSQDKSMKTDDDDDVVNLTTSLKELELQNDRLEQALKQQTQAKEAAYNELETNVIIKLIYNFVFDIFALFS